MSAAVRPAASADAAALAAFAARTFRETYAPPHGPCDPADVAAYVAAHFGPALQAAELADPAVRVLLAERDGSIAGYAQVRRGARPEGVADHAPLPDADPALVAGASVELARLYVDRAWHGRGLAALLFQAAREEAAAAGAGALWCSVYQRNPRALAFYRKHGATPIAVATFRMGRELQHDWLLAIPAASAPDSRG
jgi:GNAT superfamily N-acetyltransferase